MEAVRYRHDNEDSPNYKANQWYSDVQRGEMQRQLLTQLAKKVISWNSVTKVTEFIKIFQTYVKTDLELDETIYFATQALQVDMSTGIRQGTLKGTHQDLVRAIRTASSTRRRISCPTLNELRYQTPTVPPSVVRTDGPTLHRRPTSKERKKKE